MTRRRLAAVMAAAVIAAAIGVDVLLSACGGGGGSPTGPTQVEHYLVTITGSGVSPATLRVRRCGAGGACSFTVLFTNGDSEPHDVRSDPHPEHTTCPAVSVGIIAAGQAKETPDLSGCLTEPVLRTYHDETRPDDQRFQGRIELQ